MDMKKFICKFVFVFCVVQFIAFNVFTINAATQIGAVAELEVDEEIDCSLVGDLNITAYGKAENLKWSFEPTGGTLSDAWRYTWIDASTKKVLGTSRVLEIDVVDKSMVIVAECTYLDVDGTTVLFHKMYNINITILPEPSCTLNGDLNVAAYRKAENLKWSFEPSGGTPTGWRYSWTDTSTESVLGTAQVFQLASVDKSMVIKADCIYVENEGEKVIFKKSYIITITITAEASCDLSGDKSAYAYVKTENLRWEMIPTGGYTSGWTYVWVEVGTGNILGREKILNLPTYTNQSATDMIVKVRGVATNKGDDGKTVFEKTFDDIVVTIFPTATSELVCNDPLVYQETTQPITCTAKSSGGNSNGWNYKWTYQGGTSTGSTFTIPSFTNTTDEKMTRTAQVEITNQLPGGKVVYKNIKSVDVVVYATPFVITESEYTGFQGYPGEVKLTLGGFETDSKWEFVWEYQGNKTVSTQPTFSFEFPTGETLSPITTNISVTATNKIGDRSLNVRNGIQTLKCVAYSQGKIEKNPIDSTNVYAGSKVVLSVNALGGNPSGWKFAWTDNGKPVGDESNVLNTYISNESNSPTIHTFSVTGTNHINTSSQTTSSSATFEDITIWPICHFPDKFLLYDDCRGCYSDTYAIREGNTFTLKTGDATGGYIVGGVSNNNYLWQLNVKESNKQMMSAPAVLHTTDITQLTGMYPCRLSISNVGPSGKVWDSMSFSHDITIYKRPKTPDYLKVMGNGSACTYVTELHISDDQMIVADYYLVFGYVDQSGISHDAAPIEQEMGTLRWCTFEKDVFSNTSNKFYVYSLWIYEDGSEVTSGKRYVNSVDDLWDGSVFASESRSVPSTDDSGSTTDVQDVEADNFDDVRIYSLDGQLFNDTSHLRPGIYIKVQSNGLEKKSSKFIVK